MKCLLIADFQYMRVDQSNPYVQLDLEMSTGDTI
jgi:hypothetical protein